MAGVHNTFFTWKSKNDSMHIIQAINKNQTSVHINNLFLLIDREI